MANEEVEVLQTPEDFDSFARRERILLNNPVIMQGLGLAPLLVAATSAKNALLLGIAALLLIVGTRIVGAVVARAVYARFRGAVYALISAALFIGVYWVMVHLFSRADIALVGLYLPLLVVDPIVLKRYENPRKETVVAAAKKGLRTALGFFLVLFLSGSVRELLGSGAFFGMTLFAAPPMPLFRTAAGGFMGIAVLMAVWRGLVTSFKKQIKKGAKQSV